MPRLIWLATRALMEILGLDPYQSETQYLEGKFRVSAKRQQCGNMFPLRCHFVVAFSRRGHQSGNTVETYFHFT